jgi:tetratricopeptide (TPR) repeat protein
VRNAYSGAITAMQKSDWPAAQSLLENLAASHPELPGPAVNLAIVYSHLDRSEDARKTLDQVVAHFPGFAPGQHQLGLLLTGQGKFEAADAAYAQALAADPHYALAYYDRAVLNDLYLQRPQVALQNYQQYQSLQSAPDKQVAGWIDDLRRRVAASSPKKDGSGGPRT